jgi:hypothetical protein
MWDVVTSIGVQHFTRTNFRSDYMLQKKKNYEHSIGDLHQVAKTKENAPCLKGKIRIRQEHLQELSRKIEEDGGDAATAQLAGWINRDASGEFITIILTPPYQRRYEDEGAHLGVLLSKWDSN